MVDVAKVKLAAPLMDQIDQLQPTLDHIQQVLDDDLLVTDAKVLVNDTVHSNPKIGLSLDLNLTESTALMQALKQIVKDRIDALKAQIQAI